ncbi:MAG: sensor domain-containing diguanylate cyclase [Deltaproteobacteria bacterium]|nr:sensor domain-containing diguanylate cyclase [Deltaproteobacteria bacterium]
MNYARIFVRHTLWPGAPEESGEGAVPQAVRLEEPSVPNPPTPPGPILTVSSEEISRFFVRARRDQDWERWDIRLDAALREILERANDFVPSESGGILLDDPRAKLAGVQTPRLTFIAVYGPASSERLGRRIPSDRGFVGEVYRTGAPRSGVRLGFEDPITILCPPRGTSKPAVDSIIGVPVIVGESICGVLTLVNRRSGGPYTARDGELLRIFAAYMSSSIQNALDAIRARALSRLDHLTGLFNSRYFHVRLQDEIVRCDRDGSNLCVLFIDLDNFKVINDRYGHLAGSWSLREVARVLSEKVPAASILARYGGDEFAVLLPGSDLPHACRAAEELRQGICDLALFDTETDAHGPGMRLPSVQCSIGVASYRDHLGPGGTKRRRENVLLRLADAAMYKAKASGRNRVEVADGED